MTWFDYWKNIFEGTKLLICWTVLDLIDKLAIKRLNFINKLDSCALKLYKRTHARLIVKGFIRRNRRFIKIMERYRNRSKMERDIKNRFDEIDDEQKSFLWYNYGIRL